MTIKRLFFSTDGRIDKSDFIVGVLGVIAALLYAHLGLETLFLQLSAMAVFPIDFDDMRNFSLTGAFLMIMVPFSAIAAKRMHDWGSRGMIVAGNLVLAVFLLTLSGFRLPLFADYDNHIIAIFAFSLFFLNAMMTLYIAVTCLFLPGNPSKNKYGQALMARRWFASRQNGRHITH